MSTRGWYDYYIIAPHTGTLSLAMRFYKWGDATPENALDEYLLFRETLDAHDGRLPVEWLDRLLRDQLGELHPELPPQFAIGAFLFLLQRAAEWIECDSWRRFDPPEEREDLPLCYALEEALGAEPFEIAPHPDPLLEQVRRFIATARYLRPWRNYGLRLNLLGWLQYLTQPTRSADMGSLAGDWDPHWDIAYQYRLFFWIAPDDPFRIERIDEFDRLLTLADAVIDSPDSEAWLAALGEAVQQICPRRTNERPTFSSATERGPRANPTGESPRSGPYRAEQARRSRSQWRRLDRSIWKLFEGSTPS